jgi:hypothetical protein
MCNARRILLRREARDESSARNSVSCQSLATLRYAVTLQVCTHLNSDHAAPTAARAQLANGQVTTIYTGSKPAGQTSVQ